jgi:DNA-binding transcriptional regulator/RsmH inhibitor MraZ
MFSSGDWVAVLTRGHGYVGRAQTTLNRVGRTPIPAAWHGRLLEQSPAHARDLVVGLAPDPSRSPHLLLMAPGDIAHALEQLESLPVGHLAHRLWRRFNRNAVQVARDAQDRIVIPKSLREAAGLGVGELVWLGDRGKLRLFGAEAWALFEAVEDGELGVPSDADLAAERGRLGSLL